MGWWWLLAGPLCAVGVWAWWTVVYRAVVAVIRGRRRRQRTDRQIQFVYSFCQQLNAERIEALVMSTRIPDDIGELEL